MASGAPLTQRMTEQKMRDCCCYEYYLKPVQCRNMIKSDCFLFECLGHTCEVVRTVCGCLFMCGGIEYKEMCKEDSHFWACASSTASSYPYSYESRVQSQRMASAFSAATSQRNFNNWQQRQADMRSYRR